MMSRQNMDHLPQNVQDRQTGTGSEGGTVSNPYPFPKPFPFPVDPLAAFVPSPPSPTLRAVQLLPPPPLRPFDQWPERKKPAEEPTRLRLPFEDALAHFNNGQVLRVGPRRWPFAPYAVYCSGVGAEAVQIPLTGPWRSRHPYLMGDVRVFRCEPSDANRGVILSFDDGALPICNVINPSAAYLVANTVGPPAPNAISLQVFAEGWCLIRIYCADSQRGNLVGVAEIIVVVRKGQRPRPQLPRTNARRPMMAA